MEICWLDDALADMTLIYSHIVADDPRAAASVVARIRASVRLLVTAPNRAGRAGGQARAS